MRKSKQSIREVLNMLKWHPGYEFDETSLVYIDRPKGFSILNAAEIEDIGHKFIYLRNGDVIPIHRIVEIRYADKTFWRRRNEGGNCEE
jgi:uncharacterized protein (UPF0248 family)